MIRRIAMLFFAATLLIGAATSARAADKLVVISPHWEGIRREFTKGFQKWYRHERHRDVEIQWLDQGGASDDLRFIRSEFDKNPKGIGVDIFWGGGMDPFVELAGANLLEPVRLPDAMLKKIPSQLNGVPLYDAKYRWYGASLAGFGILYNKKLVSSFRLPRVKSWADLASPDLIGWVGSGDPRHSSSLHVMYEIILQNYGWERGWSILLPMGANVKTFPKSSSQTQKDLATGEIAYGLSIDTYAYTAIEEMGADKIGFVFPRKATIVTPDPIAMLKGATNEKTARDFIRYTLTPEAQRLWMLRKGVRGGPVEFSLNKMSMLPELYRNYKKVSNVQVNPFEGKAGFRYDFDKGAKRWNALNDLIGVFLIDNHNELTAAWKKTVKSGKKKDIAKFGTFPVSEKDVMTQADAMQNDAVVRNKQINKWLEMARKKYGGK